jgi:hypothetical protein
VLSSIGLALDLIGATALAVGLFRRPRPLFVGWSHSPDDAARDVAYGVTGWTFLALGFTFQSLPYFGVAEHGSHGAALAAALATVALGAVAAAVLFGVTFLLVLPGEIRYSSERHDLHLHVRRQRQGFRFWHQVPDAPPAAPGTGAPPTP